MAPSSLTNYSSVAAAVGDAGEFVVHTKHTCDKCFQRPILGKRYTSGGNSNFDLCSRCFETCTGPGIGMMDTALDRDKKISRDFVLKLRIDNGRDVQVRRMKVADIWDNSSSNLSLSKLLAVAAGFILNEGIIDDVQREDLIAQAKATYLDEDGDEVNVSSDNEVKDAFLQVLAVLPIRKPLLVSVTFPKAVKVPEEKAPAVGMPKRIRIRKVEPTGKKAFSASTAEPSVLRCNMSKGLRITPQNCDNELFIHARHGCNGCFKAPIIGTRYHATKIPEFDLCGSCFDKYEGDDIGLLPEIQACDLRMQHEWRKYWGSLLNAMAGVAEHLNMNIQESHTSGTESTAATNPPEHAGVKEVQQEPTAEIGTNACSSQTVHRFSVGQEPKMPVTPLPGPGAPDESFLPDADGNGSIAEVIGRTLDLCVAAMDELQTLGNEGDTHQKLFLNSKASVSDDVTAAVAACLDTFSVASSIVSGMTEMNGNAAETTNGPFVVTGKTVMKSDNCIEEKDGIEVPTVVEDVSNEEDGWSVVVKSMSSELSPVVLAKWDSELRQLHEMGFLDDRSNIDSLECLEASHIGVDSTDEVTIDQVVDHILEHRID